MPSMEWDIRIRCQPTAMIVRYIYICEHVPQYSLLVCTCYLYTPSSFYLFVFFSIHISIEACTIVIYNISHLFPFCCTRTNYSFIYTSAPFSVIRAYTNIVHLALYILIFFFLSACKYPHIEHLSLCATFHSPVLANAYLCLKHTYITYAFCALYFLFFFNIFHFLSFISYLFFAPVSNNDTGL